jgi:predicted HTH transcriptional regulator
MSETLKLLKRKAMTAREIATATRCSVPTAHARIAALVASGQVVRVENLKLDRSATGPKPQRFRATTSSAIRFL